MWKLYDDLIDAIPDDVVVDECLAGLSWFLVRSLGTGVAMRPLEMDSSLEGAGTLAGRKVKELAQRIKSWKFYEAALGLAAINSVLNAEICVHANCGAMYDPRANADVFNHLREELRGKRVAVIGHFYNLERLSEICTLSILERKPQRGDLPDPACEYILQEQDVVIMTATTLINKTMPRLLELSRNARVVVAGPSTPLHPLMFAHGVDVLGGLVVDDEPPVWRSIREGGQMELFTRGGRMVKVVKPAEAQQTA